MYDIIKDGFAIVKGGDGKLYVEVENIHIKLRAVVGFLNAIGVPISKEKLKAIADSFEKPAEPKATEPTAPTTKKVSKDTVVAERVLYFILDKDAPTDLATMLDDCLDFEVVDKDYWDITHCIHEDWSMQPYVDSGALTEEQADQVCTILRDDYGIDTDASESMGEIWQLTPVSEKCTTIYELCNYINTHEAFPFKIMCVHEEDIMPSDEEVEAAIARAKKILKEGGK